MWGEQPSQSHLNPIENLWQGINITFHRVSIQSDWTWQFSSLSDRFKQLSTDQRDMGSTELLYGHSNMYFSETRIKVSTFYLTNKSLFLLISQPSFSVQEVLKNTWWNKLSHPTNRHNKLLRTSKSSVMLQTNPVRWPSFNPLLLRLQQSLVSYTSTSAYFPQKCHSWRVYVLNKSHETNRWSSSCATAEWMCRTTWPL